MRESCSTPPPFGLVVSPLRLEGLTIPLPPPFGLAVSPLLPLVELLNSFYSVSLLNYWTVTCLRYWTYLWSFSLMRVDSWTYFFLILPRNRYYLTSPSLFIHSIKQLTPVSHAAPSPISSWTYLLMRKKSKSRLNQLLLLRNSLWMRL